MSNEYIVQTGKVMKSRNGEVLVNKQYAFDYDGKKANVVIKDNNDLHQYKLSNKNIDDMFTRIMQNKNVSLKDKLKEMLEEEKKNKKENKKENKKKNKKENKKENKKKEKTRKAKKTTKNTKKKKNVKNNKQTNKRKSNAASKTRKKV